MAASSRNRSLSRAADLARSLPLGDLLSIGTQLRADITPALLLREVAETIHRVMRNAQVYVRLRNADTDDLEAVAFAGIAEALQEQLRRTPVVPSFYQSLLQQAVRVGDSFLVAACLCEPTPNAAVLAEGSDVLLVPLRGRGDRLLGVIYIIAPDAPQAFDAANVQVLEAIARQAALALENVRLADRSARLLAKEQLLAELGRDVSATLDLETILTRTVARLELAFHSGSIALLNDEGSLQLAAAADAVDDAARSLHLPFGVGIIGDVAEHGDSFFSSDIGSDLAHRPDSLQHEEQAVFFSRHVPLRSCIVVPLRSGGQVIGTLNVGSSDVGAFSYDDVDLLEAIAAQVGGPITSARLYEQLQRLANQVQRRADQLTVLNALARTATATLDLQSTLTEIVSQIQHGFGYDHVELFLTDEETNELVLSTIAGSRRVGRIGYRQHIGLGLLGRAVRTGTTQQVDDVRLDQEYFLEESRADTLSELCVPIIATGRVMGALNLESQQVAAFTTADVAVLETAADILAGAIENARLYQRAQAAAVLEERNRLARELHDSVTQQLFSMTLTAQAARAHLEKNPQRAAQQLERLQETASAALAEMRALIFQLRPPALREQGLVAALNQHAAVVSRREGLRIELTVTGDERLARGIEQPIYRIVQEALNNVVKHAQASSVRVVLEFSAERVRLRVSDDGQGFDINAPQTGNGRHLGLISMRERAAEINGTMELRSTIGGGTEVIVTVPRAT